MNKYLNNIKNIGSDIKPFVTNLNYWSILLLISGTLSIIFGGISYFLIVEIKDFALSVIIGGSTLSLLGILISPKSAALIFKGRRGRYGTNSLIMLIAFVSIAVLANSFFILNSYRLDTTATRVFSLSKQTEKILSNLETPIRANAFFVPDDPEQEKLKTNAEDLLLSLIHI